MASYILSIDIGTTSAKALAVTPDGKVLYHQQRFYPTYYPKPEHVEQDPNLILQAVQELIREGVNSITDASISGLVFSCAMHGVMAVDDRGQPLTSLIIWADCRSAQQAQALKESPQGKLIYHQTGTPIHPMSPLCKILWLTEHEPDLVARAHKFISVKEFILFYLIGEYVIDYSIASATGLFNSHTLHWCEAALQHASITPQDLSRPVSPRQRFEVSPSASALLGLPARTPLIIGASDGCLAQLGSQAMNDGDMTITLGTSGAVRIAPIQVKEDKDARTFCYLLTEHVFICGGATNNGTALLDWFAKQFNVTSNIVQFAQEAESIPPGAAGLVVLPYWLGERAPIYDPHAKGVFFGVTMNHTPQHFQRALLEGICFELRAIVESVENLYGKQPRIFVSGGFVRSIAWVQMLSDVLGRPLFISDHHDASAMGAAMLGFEALGTEMISLVGEPMRIDPNLRHQAMYESQYQLFKKLTTCLLPFFSNPDH